MLSRCCNLTTLPLPFPLSFASLDTHGNGIAESSGLTDYYNKSCRYRLFDDHDARAMLSCVEFFFCFDQGIGSRSAAWASRVDVVWVSVCVSSVVGWCSYVRWCCIVIFMWHCMYWMYPHLLCDVYVIDGDTYIRHTMPHEYNITIHNSIIRLRMKHKQKLKRHPSC